MSTYIVGDIQGCFAPLKKLLDCVQFDPARDQLWSVGDVVNRGPDSLSVLRYLKNLGDSFQMVLGNHDLHLLAVANQKKSPKKSDTLGEILKAPDRDELLHWLRHQPLIYKQKEAVLVHAGIPHIWTLSKALDLASEVEQILKSDDYCDFLSAMYGNEPNCWNDALCGMERLRVITNYLTRMRICKADGTLNLDFKSSPDNIPVDFKPWFSFYPAQLTKQADIFFGHWAALESKSYATCFHALDSGCVWGGKLTLFKLDDKKIFNCNCK